MHLDLHGLVNNLDNALIRQLIVQVLVEQAGEVRVHALVARDQLVREGEARHEATFLEPED